MDIKGTYIKKQPPPNTRKTNTAALYQGDGEKLVGR